MGIRKEKFSEEGIIRIKTHLLFYQEKSNPIDYEIEVDQFKAVRRTNDPEFFDYYKTFLDENTSEILIRLYCGKSNCCDKIIFRFAT